MKKVELTGRVFAGRGEGKKFLEFPWVKAQIIKKLGFKPYPGTLNLRLTEDSSKLGELVDQNKLMKICPPTGYFEGLLFRARIEDLEIGVIIPQIESYPTDVLEVISPLYLRDKLCLQNGDQVTVTVCF